MPATPRQFRFIAANCLFVSAVLLVPASAQITSSPSSLTFTSTYVGLSSHTKTITVKNAGKSSTTITAITSSCPEYKLAFGTTPATLAPGTTTAYSMLFAPDAAKTFDCDYTLTQESGSPLVVPLSGTGLASAAVVGVGPTSLSFPNQAQGTPSATQLVTISNTGTGSVILTGITITPPTFSATASSM